jgi:hypothetical protein
MDPKITKKAETWKRFGCFIQTNKQYFYPSMGKDGGFMSFNLSLNEDRKVQHGLTSQRQCCLPLVCSFK